MTVTQRDYALIKTMDDARALAERLLKDGKKVGFDVETGYSGDPFVKRALDVNNSQQFIVGFSITNSPQWARYLPLRHDDYDNLDPVEVWELFRPILESTTFSVVAHQKKFEDKNLLMLGEKGDALSPIRTGLGACTMLKAYVLGRWKEKGLKFLSNELLGVKQIEFAELFAIVTGVEKISKDAAKKLRFNSLPPEHPSVIHYACDDAALCLELDDFFDEEMANEPPSRQALLKLEHHVSRFMAEMELYGVEVDWPLLEKGYAQYPTFRKNMEDSVRGLFQEYLKEGGTDMSKVNFKSVPQLRKLLYEDLGLTTTRLTDKGELSTDKIALEGLRKKNPAVHQFLELREVDNLGTRHKKWINENSHAADKRVHASYNQVVVDTGRFSADGPAIQQLPKKWFWSLSPDITMENMDKYVNGQEYWYGNFRNYIISKPGHYLLTYDVSQGELRVLAGVSQEKRLIDAFTNGEDVHTVTAAMMLGKDAATITDDERQIGKALADDEKVLTPSGWVRMDSLHKGSVVTTPSGTAKVIGVYPQGERKIFRVRTTDGGEVRADGEHLWETARGLLTTEELEKGDTLPTAVWRPTVPTTPRIDPYSLGVLLAQGQFTMQSIHFRVAKGDKWAVRHLKLPGCAPRFFRSNSGKDEYVLSPTKKRTHKDRNPMEEILRDYGLRFFKDDGKLKNELRTGVKSNAKFIPDEIMHSSAENRLAFLRGLMDSRGEIVHAAAAVFESTSKNLAMDVQRLVWSLGGRARIVKRPTSWDKGRGKGKKGSPLTFVHFSLTEVPFANPWKAAKWAQNHSVRRTIESVTEIEEAQARCIALDDGIGLFVAGDYMVTHNTMNFALIYGMQIKSLAERLDKPLHEAQELYSNYFKQFSSVTTWMETTTREAIQNGYVETFGGRKIPLFGINSLNNAIKAQAKRSAINYPIQGGLADVVKFIMVNSYMALKAKGWWDNGVMMTMNQHDALTFEVSNDLHPEEVREVLAEAANVHIEGFPKFVIDWELGHRWGSSTKWKEGDPVYRDEHGEWHVGQPETDPEAPEDATEVQEDLKPLPTVLEPLPEVKDELHVHVDETTKERLVEFSQLLQRYPGSTEVILHMGQAAIRLEWKTSLTPQDSARISLTLGKAAVRGPDTGVSMAALAPDIDLSGL